MLETAAILLVLLWLVGIVLSHTAGGLLHLLLGLAAALLYVRIARGRRPA